MRTLSNNPLGSRSFSHSVSQSFRLYTIQAISKKYGFQAKTTFIYENSSKRKKIGTVTCLKPDNFHEVKKILRASLIFSTLGVVSSKEEM